MSRNLKTERAKKIYIRQGSSADQPALEGLLEYAQMGTSVDPGEFLVAEVNGKLAGAVRLEREDGKSYIRPVVVAPEARGSGIGRVLLEKIFLECPEIRVVARGDVVSFYRRLGFAEMDWNAVPARFREECELCPDKAECRPMPLKWTKKTR